MTDEEIPIACTLDGGSFADRVQDIRALFARSLRSHVLDGRQLRLSFDPAARDAVQDLVRKEKACCAFLDFKLEEAAEALDLTITVPPAAAENARDLLEPFLPASASASRGGEPQTAASPTWLTRGGLMLGGGFLACGTACAATVLISGVGASGVLASLAAWLC